MSGIDFASNDWGDNFGKYNKGYRQFRRNFGTFLPKFSNAETFKQLECSKIKP